MGILELEDAETGEIIVIDTLDRGLTDGFARAAVEARRVRHDLFRAAGLAPPTLRDIQDQSGLREREALDALAALQRAGALVRVSPELSLAREHHEALIAQARELLRTHGQIDVQALKTVTGLSRKFVVPFLEHLDRLQISRRQGDLRVPGPRL